MKFIIIFPIFLKTLSDLNIEIVSLLFLKDSVSHVDIRLKNS